MKIVFWAGIWLGRVASGEKKACRSIVESQPHYKKLKKHTRVGMFGGTTLLQQKATLYSPYIPANRRLLTTCLQFSSRNRLISEGPYCYHSSDLLSNRLHSSRHLGTLLDLTGISIQPSTTRFAGD